MYSEPYSVKKNIVVKILNYVTVFKNQDLCSRLYLIQLPVNQMQRAVEQKQPKANESRLQLVSTGTKKKSLLIIYWH